MNFICFEKIINKIRCYAIALLVLVTSEQAFSQVDNLDSYNGRHCQLDEGVSGIKLKLSQRLNGKNEFLVGWKYLRGHSYHHLQKPEVGGEIAIVRCLPPGHYQVIAKGQINGLNGSMIEANVTSDASEGAVDGVTLGKATRELVESRNLVWRPMVGDEVFPIYKQIAKKILALPKFQLSNKDLFIKEEEGNYSLSLSDAGQELLREKFAQFKNKNGRLLIEGFVLTTGNRDNLRTESLMRAQTVSTFLVREFSLEPSQVVAIGYGNDWLQTGMQPVGENGLSLSENAGILLKIMPE